VLLFAVSVAAGFGCKRFLPTISDHLREQLSRVQEDAEHAKREAREARHQANAAREAAAENETISGALAALQKRPHDQQELYNFTQDLSDRFQKKKSNPSRKLTMVLGRLYRHQNQLQSALDTLEEFLTVNKTRKNGDYSDVLYNKACYCALTYGKTQNDDLRLQSLECLKESIQLAPGNRMTAKEDDDFIALRDDADFAKAVADP
jgi:tetratricopeptide (TPR) repeat protein